MGCKKSQHGRALSKGDMAPGRQKLSSCFLLMRVELRGPSQLTEHLCIGASVHVCVWHLCMCASVHLCICASVHLCICASVPAVQEALGCSGILLQRGRHGVRILRGGHVESAVKTWQVQTRPGAAQLRFRAFQNWNPAMNACVHCCLVGNISSAPYCSPPHRVLPFSLLGKMRA